MNWRTTLILLASALLAGLFILTIERPARLARARSAAPRHVLPDFQPASIRSLQVLSSNRSVTLVRSNGLWELDDPLHRVARQALAEGLLNRVASLQGGSILTPQELNQRPRAVADFGLNPPVTTLRLDSPAGRTELRLGIRSINGNQVYYQVDGVPGIFATDADFLDNLPQTPDGWRDATLLPLDRLAFDRIRVASASGAFSLSRDPTNGLWEMTEPRPARADSVRVGLLLRQLGLLQISGFLPATSTPPAEIAGLRPPRIAFSLARGSNEVYSLAFGAALTNASAPSVYAQRPGEPDTLVVPAEAQELLKVPYKDLLDRRLVRFDRTQVREMAFSGSDNFLVTSGSDGWTLQPSGQKADPQLVDRLFNHLAALEMIEIAKEVVTDLDLATYGLAPPAARVTLRSKAGDTNAVLAQLEIGALRDNHMFARVPGEQPVYLLNPADIDELPRSAASLRDRALWRFDASQVVSLTARHEGVDWTVRRQGTNDWSVPPGALNELNPFALDEALHRLSEARVAAWRGSGPARAASLGIGINKGVEITLDFKGPPAQPPLRFKFGKAAPGGRRYGALQLADGSLPIFEIPGPVFDDVWRESGMAAQSPNPPQ
jgi:hypothetical protein